MKKERLGNYNLDDARREMRALLEPVLNDVAGVKESLGSLSNTVAAGAALNYAGIVNLINNSHPEWSTAAYVATGVNPADAGDLNLECHNFYRDLQSQLALTYSAAKALKAAMTIEPAEHSLWAANEGADADIPRWDKVNGTIGIGGAAARWDLYIPLPNDIVFPGQTFTVQFEAQLASVSPRPTGIQAYAGFWDRGNQKYIEGGAFTITGEIFGTPGAETVEYQILARTDSGEEAISNVLTFTNAPAVFDQNNHPRVSFSGVAGFIQFLIYRKIGSEYVHQYTVGNTIEGTYYDIGNPPIAVVSGFPTVTATTPRAYALTSDFRPGLLNGEWVRTALTVFVPTTYDRSTTAAGDQTLRIGLTALTDEPRQIKIRRTGLSQGDGAWSRSAEDLRTGVRSAPSSTATGAGGGSGGGVDPPPPPGGGHCVLLDSMVRCIADDTDRTLIELGKLAGDPTKRQKVEGGLVCGEVVAVKQAHASVIYWVETANGCRIGSTLEHPFITGLADFNGTKLSRLKKRLEAGEEVVVMTQPGDITEGSQIISITEEYGDFMVGTPTQVGSKLFNANGFWLHNKPDDGGVV